jgi:Rha family phage regulatory protein
MLNIDENLNAPKFGLVDIERDSNMIVPESIDVDEEFSPGDFAAVEYIDEKGEKRPEYLITRDGFTYLAFSYNGEASMKFKKAYIRAFKELERKLGLQVLPVSYKDALKALVASIEEKEILESKIDCLELTVGVQTQQIAEMKPKVSYYDVILATKDAIAISVIAKDYGMSAQRMNSELHKLGIQFKQGDIWLLYQKYAEQGYTSTRVFPYIGKDGEHHSSVHTYWTQKGRFFLYAILKSNGIIPMMELNYVA